MKPSEAIENLKNLRLFMQLEDKQNEIKFAEDNYKAIELTIQALEKQIPKKPVLKNNKSINFVDEEHKVTQLQVWKCSICGRMIGLRYNSVDGWSLGQYKKNYCDFCGQRIDWSEQEDEQKIKEDYMKIVKKVSANNETD